MANSNWKSHLNTLESKAKIYILEMLQIRLS